MRNGAGAVDRVARCRNGGSDPKAVPARVKKPGIPMVAGLQLAAARYDSRLAKPRVPSGLGFLPPADFPATSATINAALVHGRRVEALQAWPATRETVLYAINRHGTPGDRVGGRRAIAYRQGVACGDAQTCREQGSRGADHSTFPRARAAAWLPNRTLAGRQSPTMKSAYACCPGAHVGGRRFFT